MNLFEAFEQLNKLENKKSLTEANEVAAKELATLRKYDGQGDWYMEEFNVYISFEDKITKKLGSAWHFGYEGSPTDIKDILASGKYNFLPYLKYEYETSRYGSPRAKTFKSLRGALASISYFDCNLKFRRKADRLDYTYTDFMESSLVGEVTDNSATFNVSRTHGHFISLSQKPLDATELGKVYMSKPSTHTVHFLADLLDAKFKALYKKANISKEPGFDKDHFCAGPPDLKKY